DVSVIGFDNVELSTIVNPPLTTIHQPKYVIGQAAVEILLRLAGRGEHQAPEHRVIGVHLIERRSCMERKS
ncbi:MAG: transcriptional regulator, LacI family, partial [Candidatus Solibacter sp.]|nr:transcriptional regulator, LacI family [Candidatus Solibacter sp.]